MFANKIHEEAHKSFERGDYEEAVIAYTNALKDSPNDCTILSDRAVAYLHLNKKEACIADFDSAVKLQPTYGFRFASRAYAKKHFNDIDGAIDDYERAIDLDPKDDISQNNLGVLLEEMGAQKEANVHFDKSDELRTKNDAQLPVGEKEVLTENIPIEEKKERLTDQEIETKTEELKKIFSSKKQFSEFMKFIKNGFKIK